MADRLERSLDQRVGQVFGALSQPVVARKDLSRRLERAGRVPRFVAEFLFARAGGTEAAANQVADDLRRIHPDPHQRELWRHRLVSDGQINVLDHLEVSVHLTSGAHVGRLEGLGIGGIEVSPTLADRFPGLLTGGLWGMAELCWSDETRTYLGGFRPVQAETRPDELIEGRHYFTTDEWIDLLLTSSGYDPGAICSDLADAATRLRRKLLLLTRLTPLVEGNLNLLELGPRNTGKTYLLRSLSAKAFVVSGGRATPANLFVNLSSGRPGILAQRRVVVFDEVARLELGDPAMVAGLKDFLESGTYSRGHHEFRSDCSTVFVGNINVDGYRPLRRYRTLCDPLPEELRDSAFVDRLHGFIPGWEIPKLGPESFATGVGFLSDYFGEVLLSLREIPFAEDFRRIRGQRDLLAGATQRDQAAMERLARGLCKLVFPNGRTEKGEPALDAIFSLAGELRQRLHDQLCLMAAGEFSARPVGFQNTTLGVPPERRNQSVQTLPPRRRLAAGQVLYPDRHSSAEDRVGRMVEIQVAVLPAGRGLQIRGQQSAEAQEVLRTAYSYLSANLKLIGLPPDWLQDRTLVLQVIGERVEDGEGMMLPALLAMASALRGTVPDRPLAAVGTGAIGGGVWFSDDLALRLTALAKEDVGILVLPETVMEAVTAGGLLPHWQVLSCRDLAEALRQIA